MLTGPPPGPKEPHFMPYSLIGCPIREAQSFSYALTRAVRNLSSTFLHSLSPLPYSPLLSAPMKKSWIRWHKWERKDLQPLQTLPYFSKTRITGFSYKIIQRAAQSSAASISSWGPTTWNASYPCSSAQAGQGVPWTTTYCFLCFLSSFLLLLGLEELNKKWLINSEISVLIKSHTITHNVTAKLPKSVQ